MLSFWNFCNGPIFFLPLLFGFTAVVIVIFLEPDLVVAGFCEFLSPRLGKDINLINLNELSWEGTLKWFKHTAWETCQILLQEDELRQKAWCYISALTWPGKVSALMVSQWNPLFTKGGNISAWPTPLTFFASWTNPNGCSHTCPQSHLVLCSSHHPSHSMDPVIGHNQSRRCIACRSTVVTEAHHSETLHRDSSAKESTDKKCI